MFLFGISINFSFSIHTSTHNNIIVRHSVNSDNYCCLHCVVHFGKSIIIDYFLFNLTDAWAGWFISIFGKAELHTCC